MRGTLLTLRSAGTAAAMVAGLLLCAVPAMGQGNKLNTPTISCVGVTQHTIFLRVCAGPSGAPAGFSVQWMPLPPGTSCGSFVWPPSDDPSLCKASFSGVPGCSIYNLGANQCITVEIGNLNDAECGVGLHHCGADELECGTEYVFRAFAHNVPGPRGKNRSDFTANLCCTTDSCEERCVRTQGYWKTHPCDWPAPFVPGDNGTAPSTQCALTGNPNQQCACDADGTITIGCVDYDQCDLLCSLAQSGQGNALRILAHQLIAAKLNVLNGASDAGTVTSTVQPANPYNGMTVAALIALGDNLICGGVSGCTGPKNILTDSVAPGGPGNTCGPAMTAVGHLLDLYNNGFGGVSHCE